MDFYNKEKVKYNYWNIYYIILYGEITRDAQKII